MDAPGHLHSAHGAPLDHQLSQLGGGVVGGSAGLEHGTGHGPDSQTRGMEPGTMLPGIGL